MDGALDGWWMHGYVPCYRRSSRARRLSKRWKNGAVGCEQFNIIGPEGPGECHISGFLRRSMKMVVPVGSSSGLFTG